jgi:hypothetical protein
MTNGKLVWLNFENIDALTNLTKSFEVKSPNNVISILVDLAQKTKDIQLKQMRVCPTCNKEYEIEQITSGAYKLKDHIRHCDLDDTTCKQTCKLERRIKLESKDKANGTTDANDKNRVQTEQKTKTKEEIEDDYIIKTAKWLEEDDEKRRKKIEQPAYY